MYQPGLIDPTKGHGSQREIQLGKPRLQPTEITVALENQIFLFESLGVFIFVFGTCCFKEATGINLHFTLSIIMTFVMCNHPSNSNINPCVTLSFCGRHTKRYQPSLLWLYFKAQFCGAFAAYSLAYLLNGSTRPPLEPQIHQGSEYFKIFMSQSAAVFVLILTILQVTGPNTSYCSARIEKFLFIAIFVYLGRNFCPTSTNALNFSLTCARAVLGMFFYNIEGMKYAYIWGLGDLFGTILAILFYNYLLEPHIVTARIDKLVLNQKKETQEAIELAELVADVKVAEPLMPAKTS